MDISNDDQILNSLTPEEITKVGDDYYLTHLKEDLEKTNYGDYVVIEVSTKEYFVGSDLKLVIEQAQSKFPNSIFHIIKVGNLQKMSKQQSYDWLF